MKMTISHITCPVGDIYDLVYVRHERLEVVAVSDSNYHIATLPKQAVNLFSSDTGLKNMSCQIIIITLREVHKCQK